jgi:hypothetical protein
MGNPNMSVDVGQVITRELNIKGSFRYGVYCISVVYLSPLSYVSTYSLVTTLSQLLSSHRAKSISNLSLPIGAKTIQHRDLSIFLMQLFS